MADDKKNDKTSKEAPPVMVGPDGDLLGIGVQPEKTEKKEEQKQPEQPYFGKSFFDHVWDAKDIKNPNFPKPKPPPKKKSRTQKIMGILMPKTVESFMARIGFLAAPVLVLAGIIVAIGNPALGIPLLVAAGLALGGGLAATYHNKQMLEQDGRIIDWYDRDYGIQVAKDLTRSDIVPVVKAFEATKGVQRRHPQAACSPLGMLGMLGGYGMYRGYGGAGGYGGCGRLGGYPHTGIAAASSNAPAYVSTRDIKEGTNFSLVQRPPDPSDLVSIKVKNPDPSTFNHEVKRSETLPLISPLFSRGATERNSHGR